MFAGKPSGLSCSFLCTPRQHHQLFPRGKPSSSKMGFFPLFPIMLSPLPYTVWGGEYSLFPSAVSVVALETVGKVCVGLCMRAMCVSGPCVCGIEGDISGCDRWENPSVTLPPSLLFYLFDVMVRTELSFFPFITLLLVAPKAPNSP